MSDHVPDHAVQAGMMKLSALAMATALVCFMAGPASAETVSMRKAVNAALTLNPDVTVALAQEQSSAADRESAEWGRYPRLTIDRQPAASMTGTSTAVRLEQPLWAGGRIDGAIKVAGSQEIAQQKATQLVRQDLGERTSAAYVSLLGSVDRQKLALEAGGIFDKLLAYVRRRFESGVVSMSDVTLASIRRTQIQLLQEQLEAETAQLTAQLQSLTMMDLTGATAVEVRTLALPEIEEAEQYLLVQSPLILQRRAQIDVAKAQLQQRSAVLWPTVSLRVEEIQLPTYRDTRGGFVIQFSPDAGLAAFSQIRAAEALVKASEDRLRSEQVTAQLRVRSLKTAYLSSRSQLQQIDLQIADLEQNVGSFLRQFEAGRKTWLEVLSIHRELVDAKINKSRIREQQDQAALRLMSVGGTLQNWIESLPQ